MQFYLAVIGIVLVVMLVMFGNNPMEKAMEKRAKAGGDPLVAAIQEHNEKAQKGMFGTGTGLGGGTGLNLNPGGAASTSQNTTAPTYSMHPGQNPFAPASPYRPVPAQSSAPAANGYYPPPPPSGQASPLQR